MKYVTIDTTCFADFHTLLNAYYREGEDADTPQSEVDGFIDCLFRLCLEGRISGCIAYEEKATGFALWQMDSEDAVFSNKPGYGTILEIGVVPSRRGSGLGKQLADYAESRMGADRYYVCAYGPAEKFWADCGYTDSGEIANNGLKIMVKA